ncbi:ArnT family glycosyltransferase [Galbibacter mesophilus]|uniref:ArnT family glycosyltransferase n=1 Tax=Galbibacter mesophilus TaxID=379069 RepID=UPI00191D392A|nr:glycosyltransferase family 39 protein [Galbibacter mesophilus]MCM5662151.1 glycosyltransferase family 39 protein [Galbibacter mesophilus]
MINKAYSQKLILIFLLATIVINLIQSAYTGLIFDEAYYNYFAENLNWGYFDHPPMVALMVKIGITFFNGELGVRFMAPILYALNMWLLWQLIDHDKKYKYTWLFIAFVSSIGLLVAYGFMMVPDTPLVTFSLLFLWAYKRFLDKKDWLSVFLLGFSMAAVMYSKYHGILLIGFVVLSNLPLLKNGKFWLASVFGLLLYIPHLWWLSTVDFVPLEYHLFERSNDSYKIKFTTHYLLNCIAVAGLAFPLMYYAFFKVSSKSKFDKALKYLGVGVFLFFLYYSFTRKTQAQWVILMAIPLTLFSLRYAYENKKYRTWLFGISIFSVILILFLRVALIYQPISPLKYEAYGNKKWVKELQAQVGDVPVVFHNSYRDASMYHFYSGGATVFSINDLHDRQNQFSLDNSEFKVRGKKVAYFTADENYMTEYNFSVIQEFRTRKLKGIYIDSLVTYKRMKIEIDPENFKNSIPAKFAARLKNPYSERIVLDSLNFGALLYDEDRQHLKKFPLIVESKSVNIEPNETVTLNVKIPDTVIIPDATYFRMGIINNGTYPGFQGEKIKLK